MKLKYKVYDFVNWTVQEREREIDLDEAVKSNALLQRLAKQPPERKE